MAAFARSTSISSRFSKRCRQVHNSRPDRLQHNQFTKIYLNGIAFLYESIHLRVKERNMPGRLQITLASRACNFINIFTQNKPYGVTTSSFNLPSFSIVAPALIFAFIPICSAELLAFSSTSSIGQPCRMPVPELIVLTVHNSLESFYAVCSFKHISLFCR